MPRSRNSNSGAQYPGYLGDRTSDAIGVHAARHAADMGKIGQTDQRAATEVQAEELDLLGGVSCSGRHDQRP